MRDWQPRPCSSCNARPARAATRSQCWRCAYPQVPPPPCKVCGIGEFWTKGYCRNCHPLVKQRSCIHCYAWGAVGRRDGHPTPGFLGPVCYACDRWRRRNRHVAPCRHCGRLLPLLDDHCRLCWNHARLLGRDTAYGRTLEWLRDSAGHQLWLAGIGPAPGRPERRSRSTLSPPSWRPPTARQLRLFEFPRDLSRFDRAAHADALDEPRLAHARALAARLAQEHGWTHERALSVDRALVAVLCGQPDDGNPVPYSELAGLVPRKLPVDRTAEVLAAMGLLLDDRPDLLAHKVEAELAGIGPGIASEVARWVEFLRGRLPRSRARSPETIKRAVAYVAPVLRVWCARYDSLRAVTSDDIKPFTHDPTAGVLEHRRHVLRCLRSLFRLLRRERLVFADPTAHLSLPTYDRSQLVPSPLADEDLRVAFTRATDPDTRLLLLLACVQALRPVQMRRLRLEHVDLGRRALIVDGHERPLDAITYQSMVDYLDHRRCRWPGSSNPFLLVTGQTAVKDRPVSKGWMTIRFRDIGIPLDRLRRDRFVEELLARGPDPLHFRVVFGVCEATAIRYARAAERMLTNDPIRETTRP